MPSIVLIHPTDDVTELLSRACQPLIQLTWLQSISEAKAQLALNPPSLFVVSAHLASDWLQSVAGTPLATVPHLVLTDDQTCWMTPSLPETVGMVFAPYTEWELRMRLMMHLPWPLLKVVVLDSSGVILDGVSAELEWSGVACHVMKSDQGLADQLAQIQPHMVVVDTEMPELNRQSVLSVVAQQSLPILGVVSSSSYQKIGRSMGYDDFIALPFGGVELLYRMYQLIRRGGNRDVANRRQSPSLESGHVGSTGGWSNTLEFPTGTTPLTDVMVTLHHEINSPLTGIKLGAQTLEKRVSPSEQALAREIVASAKRIESTLDRMHSSNRVTQDVYMNGTTMAVFETEPFPWA